jgi:hypothetical protein
MKISATEPDGQADDFVARVARVAEVARERQAAHLTTYPEDMRRAREADAWLDQLLIW